MLIVNLKSDIQNIFLFDVESVKFHFKSFINFKKSNG